MSINGIILFGSAPRADPTVLENTRGDHSKQRPPPPRGAEGPATLHRYIPPVYVPVFWEHLPQIPEQHA